MAKRFGTALIALGLWLLLCWPLDAHTGRVDGTAVVAGLYPSVKAARLEPLETLRLG